MSTEPDQALLDALALVSVIIESPDDAPQAIHAVLTGIKHDGHAMRTMSHLAAMLARMCREQNTSPDTLRKWALDWAATW